MSSVPSEVSKYMGNAVKLADIWGDLIFNVKSSPYNAKGNGIKNDTTSIATAIAVASVTGGVVSFPPGSYLTDGFTVPSNVTLQFSNGAKLSISAGATVTINGPVSTGLQQIFSGSGNASGFKLVPEFYPQWWGAIGDGATNSTVAFQKSLLSVPLGGVLRIPVGNYKITGELTIAKTMHIIGNMAEDLGQTYLDFNLDSQSSTSVGIRINNQIHGCILQDFYMSYSGSTTTHDGILFDGVEGNYPNYIWYSKIEGIYVRGFRHNFHMRNVCIFSAINCRSIQAKGHGFYLEGFLSTAVSYISCYSQDSVAIGFNFINSYYSGCSSCYSDGNVTGFLFQDSYGGYVRDCGSETSVNYAVHNKNSISTVDNLTTQGSGTIQSSIFKPTVVYVESGRCDVRGIIEQQLPAGNTRLYTILYEDGATGNTVTTNAELLDIRIPYDGGCSIDAQYLTQGTPTKTGWKTKDIGKVVYNQNATELGSTPNKYIIYGYRRMTAGNGNVLNTDWLPLRALTGN